MDSQLPEQNICYLETIPILAVISWIPSQSDRNDCPLSHFDLPMGITNQSERNINIDRDNSYIKKSKQMKEAAQDSSYNMHEDRSKMDTHGECTSKHGLEFIEDKLPSVDIVIEDYSSSTSHCNFDSVDHNDNKCVSVLNNKNDDKTLEESSPLHRLIEVEDKFSTFSVEEADEDLHSLTENLESPQPAATESLSSSDLDKLKVIATRLNLQTRRSSYVTWRNKLSATLINGPKTSVDHSSTSKQVLNQSDDQKLNHPNRQKYIAESLSFIKSELMEIRKQDQSLARQFICLRNEIQQLKMQYSKQAFDDMVDDAQWTLAENEQFDNVCDEPRKLDKSPLLTLGITKMNLTKRRFSVF